MVTWNYASLAEVKYLNHDFASLADGKKLYTCTFTTDDDRYGYLIFEYLEKGPAVKQWSLHETHYPYDQRENVPSILAALKKAGVDPAEATAQRVEWMDTAKNRVDRIILFKDGKGNAYICYFGEYPFTLEKHEESLADA